ncbi:MAG: undecaprenyldiphospho-muramoylpentapeptide beta-N-acetylglucosaminyltransferase [Lachnospiraceae bacterium]|nr:undecaprenyldiphospho-muramoylpentapeptide beta-N-acetylglucosaminyltransferase [Lachnospiraceae bacterium]
MECVSVAKKIVLTGGGTAGHCYPNLALVPTLKEMDYDITYIGSYEGIEKGLVEAEGLRYYGISTGKLRRYFDVKNFTDPIRVIKGFAEARHVLRVISPDVVFSKGGFVSVPVVKAAASLKIPVVIHESDMTPGLANRLSYSSAKKICCSFKDTLSHIPGDKGVFSGSPIRASLLEGDAKRAGSFVNMPENDLPYLMIIGGSQGAQNVNEAVRAALPELTERYKVIHLCGRGKLDMTLQRMKGYMQYEYISEELADLYALADVVISRAGSNAIFELLALKKPSLLIPLSTAGSRGDQILNARAFADNGYCRVLLEEDMNTESLVSAVDEVYANRDTYVKAMEAAPENGAVRAICDVIDDISNEKG